MPSSDPTPIDVSTALSPNDIDAVPDLVKEIQASTDALATSGDEARHELVIKARSLVQALETPRETMIKHCWAQLGGPSISSFPLPLSPR